MAASNKIQMTGNRYGRLLVIDEAGRSSVSLVNWLCRCDCGKEKIISGNSLRRNLTTSCGCLQKEVMRKIMTTHGADKTPEYRSWLSAKGRCTNPKNAAFHNYGGRGIRMCDRWIDSFENFFADMGKRPSILHSLDRYPNKNGNYEPTNCRWATEKQQQGNRTNNRWFECEGKNMIVQDWAIYFGVTNSAIYRHLRNNKSFQEIFNHYKNKQVA